jgi:hypothetical protein
MDSDSTAATERGQSLDHCLPLTVLRDRVVPAGASVFGIDILTEEMQRSGQTLLAARSAAHSFTSDKLSEVANRAAVLGARNTKEVTYERIKSGGNASQPQVLLLPS